ncbi:hypothetical protein ACIBK8_08635 [Streptomyces sp. NPDC050161]|uniref:hypothetical protein n=1 Tax=Streptomyces sp. NPDC050161 TaxID=3365604 RepID=UPI00379DD636
MPNPGQRDADGARIIVIRQPPNASSPEGRVHMAAQLQDDVRDIPDYQALVVFDMKGYSKVPSPYMQSTRDEFDNMLATAFVESGLGDEWQHCAYWNDRGDGCILAMPIRRMWRLVEPLPEILDGVLARYDRERFASMPEIRVRMSVHLGPVSESYRGDPINDACRLIDSDAARDAVAKAEQLGSYVALVISEAVFQAVVRARRTTRLTELDFLPTRAEVKDKYSEPAWVHVPRRSPSALSAPAESPAAQDTQPAQGAAVTPGGPPASTAPRTNTIDTVNNYFDAPQGPLTFTQDFRRTGR